MAQPALEALVEALRRQPGVGPRSAQRIAHHLLQHDRPGMLQLARALEQAADKVGHCARCHAFSESPLCAVCQDPGRDSRMLCVVESEADQAAMERTGSYQGLYHVLKGRLSPIDGMGLESLGVEQLLQRAGEPGIEEVIMATGFTAEGEATAHALASALRARGVKVTRLARGVPAGSDIEFVDLSTIAHALSDRR